MISKATPKFIRVNGRVYARVATAPKYIKVNGAVYERIATTALDTVAEVRREYQDKIDNANRYIDELRQEAASSKDHTIFIDNLEYIEFKEDHVERLTEVIKHIDANDWEWLRKQHIINSPTYIELTKTSEPELEAERWERKLNKPMGRTPVKQSPKFLSVDSAVTRV